jgi:hypothetical protein
MLIIIFGVWLRWFPISGSDTWAHLVLPAITLASWILPINMRLVRSGMLDVLNQDYIRTARAKGLPQRTVLLRHVLRNSLIPIVTLMAGLLPEEILGMVKQPYRAADARCFLGRGGDTVLPDLLSPTGLSETGCFDPPRVQRLVAKLRSSQVKLVKKEQSALFGSCAVGF